MVRKIAMIVVVTALIAAGIAFVLLEPIRCFFYLNSSHEGQITFLRKDGVYIMDADGSNQCQILSDDSYIGIAWSPDGEQLALINLAGNIYTVKHDGSERKQIVSSATTDDRLTFSWSPDGTQIAFMRESDTGGIYVVDVASDTERQITQGFSARFPVWSPQGDWVAFVTKESGLYIVRPDGSELQQLADEAASDQSPTWSPDGEMAAFINLNYEISIVDLDGSGAEAITDLDREYDGQVFNIMWSPTSDQIVAEVILSPPHHINLFLVELATGETHKLTEGIERDTRAVWTPDGAYILYIHLPDDVLSRVNATSGLIERLALESDKPAARPH
jgi:Tol biopolymer transport system component